MRQRGHRNAGIIAGYGKERVIHSPATGILLGRARIGDRVEKGDTIAVIVTGQGEVPVEASLTGLSGDSSRRESR